MWFCGDGSVVSNDSGVCDGSRSGKGESIGLLRNGPGSQVSGIMRHDRLFCRVWSDWLCMYWQKQCHGNSNESSGEGRDYCLWSFSAVSAGAYGVWLRCVSCRTDSCHSFVVRISLYVCDMGGKYPSVCEKLEDQGGILIGKV